VHLEAASVLSTLVMELLAPEAGEEICDLYAGVGLFSLPIAEAVGPTGRVVIVESAPSAAEDARINLAGHPRAVVLETPVSASLLNELLEDADACVIDPPRAGIDAKSLAAIGASDVQRLVMVSCNPATFARDLKGLAEAGFRLKVLRALDLFEMTEHVEVVALLAR
jgi:tRNA/tmRNA/rRNA uracil-C5-methylase (TrmA/RlmC/RlmD family)